MKLNIEEVYNEIKAKVEEAVKAAVKGMEEMRGLIGVTKFKFDLTGLGLLRTSAGYLKIDP